MSYSSRYGMKKKTNKVRYLIAFILVSLACLAGWILISKDDERPVEKVQEQQQESAETKEYQSIDLQTTIDNWTNKYPATYAITVYDLQNGEIIGKTNQDNKLFAASLYKIYVAYFSLIDFQTGAQNPEDILIANQTKKECVDKMIRSSDSPCGEAMMAEIGQTVLNQRAETIGMTNTTFNGIQTSAADSALIVKYIDQKRDLNQENTDFLLDSMLTQESKFKRGLQTGAPEAKWNTKVGWNEDINYHDIGIMTLPDGRKFAVAIMAQGSGSPEPISDFASTIYSALTQTAD